MRGAQELCAAGQRTGIASRAHRAGALGLVWGVRRACACAGSVLVPVDTAGRLLEVLLVLAGFWESAAMKAPLVLLSHVALTVLELARSQLEWLAEGLSKSLAASSGSGNPFTCRCPRGRPALPASSP